MKFLNQINSMVTEGTAPAIINSTTKIDNLNADLLDGLHASNFEADITKSIDAPSDPIDNTLWIDTSSEPYILKVYKSSEDIWVAVGSLGGSGHIIKDDTSAFTNRTNLQFTGLLSVSDNGTDTTIVNVTGTDISGKLNLDQTTPQSVINGSPIMEGVQFDITPSTTNESEGLMRWNTDDGTLDVGLPGGVTGQMFQEMFYDGKNGTGADIPNGTPVMFAAPVGMSGKVEIQKAIANGTIPSEYIMGISTESIANGEFGKVTCFGKVRGLNTTGTPYSETWAQGDLIYVGLTSGSLTNVVPSPPSQKILIASVITVSATVGTLLVRPTWSTKFTDLEDVNGTPLTESGQIAIWDNDNKYFDFTQNINDKKTDLMSTNKLLGRASTDSGVIEEITLGSNLSFDGTTLNISSDNAAIIKREEFIATAGQTLFTLTLGSYVQNNNTINIFIQGIKQPSEAYTETSTTSFTFDSGLEIGDLVLVEWYENDPSIKGEDGYTPIKGVDYFDGTDGAGVLEGGTIGQILTKKTSDDYDTEWKDVFIISSSSTPPASVVDGTLWIDTNSIPYVLKCYNLSTTEWVIVGSIGGGSADTTTYDNTTSGLVAENVQEAIDEVYEDSITAIDEVLTGALPRDADTLGGELPSFYSLPNGFGSGAGINSIVHGTNNIASSDNSYAGGLNNISSGESAHAEGTYTIASGNNSHAEGNYGVALGLNSHAEGEHSAAITAASHSGGQFTLACHGTFHKITAFDDTTKTITLDNVTGLVVTDLLQIKITGAQALIDVPITVINGLIVTLNTTEIITSSWLYAIEKAITMYTTHAEGRNTMASGDNSHVEGSFSIATGSASHAEGRATIASGIYAHAEGYTSTASGQFSHAEGQLTISSGNNSHTEGLLTIASGIYSHAEGQSTIASGTSSHAEGQGTIAGGLNSHAGGLNSVALTDYTYAEGLATLACQGTLYKITAFDNITKIITLDNVTGLIVTDLLQIRNNGYGTIVDVPIIAIDGLMVTLNTTATIMATCDYAIKKSTTALSGGHAEGQWTISCGNNSHSEGSNTIASGLYSHSQNQSTTSQGYAQTVIGRFNTPQGTQGSYVNTDKAFIIGNGTADGSRSDAVTVDWQGNTVLSGTLVTTGTPTESQTISYTLGITNRGKLQNCNSSSAIVVTIPLNTFAIDTEIVFVRYGTGAVSFTPISGVTLNSSASKRSITNQYEAVTLKLIATNEWLLLGSLSA